MAKRKISPDKSIITSKEISLDGIISRLRLTLLALEGAKDRYKAEEPFGCLSDSILETIEELERLSDGG